jgi:DNA-binding MarR family transcriptional regulator
MDRSSYLLLGLLEKEGPLTVGEISELFKLDNSTVSRQISTLHKKELATRYSDKEDARISMVEITEKGRQELQSAKQYRLEAYTELLEDWTEDELQVFSRLLTRLNRSIEKRKKLR